MSYAELVRLYFERSTALQWYWTLYVLVIGGLLAFSSLRTRKDLVTGILVTALFCCFAYKNVGAIHDVSEQQRVVLQAIHGFSTQGIGGIERSTLEPTLAAPEWEGTRNFHLACDILTVLAVWAMEWRRIKRAKLEPPPAP